MDFCNCHCERDYLLARARGILNETSTIHEGTPVWYQRGQLRWITGRLVDLMEHEEVEHQGNEHVT